MSDIERVATRELKTRYCEIGTGIFSPHSNVMISLRTCGVSIDIHLTREEAMQLSKNLEEIVAEYDATVDRYHDVCDEPVVAGVQ